MRHAILIALALTLVVVVGTAQDRGSLTDRFDANGDGKLSKGELPEKFRRIFEQLDTDGDGFVTPEEEKAFRGRRERSGGRNARTEPTRKDVSYGPHERNVLDVWKAAAEGPTPLVIYFHGGGFRAGDKRSISPALVAQLLERGVSVAAANYRLTQTAPFPAQMRDAGRAIQFLRENAKVHGIDPARIGATGGSAGAGISLWLAFHDDLADPENEDPVLRQSTRLSAAVVYGGQSSYDPRFISKLFDTTEMHPALYPFFGMEGPEDIEKEEFHPLFVEASPMTHATKDDPPVYLFYPQANEELPPGTPGARHIHHPKFGFVLKEVLDPLGVPCVVRLREEVPKGKPPFVEYVDFFLEAFRMREAPAEAR